MSKVIITEKWEFDTNSMVCSNDDLGGDIFKLVDKSVGKVESSFPSERMNPMTMYECHVINHKADIPLGIIRRAAELSEIAKVRDVDQYQLEAYKELSNNGKSDI